MLWPLVAATLALVALLVAGLLRGGRPPAGVTVTTPTDDTRTDADGAVHSVQGADIELPEQALDDLWTPYMLERLARTYWSFMTACTFGLVRMHYTPGRRSVCLLGPPLRLLTFDPPEYEVDDRRGVVRWRIRRGLLVAQEGHDGTGYLELEVTRRPDPRPGTSCIHVEVEIANFYPQIASRLGQWLYAQTQSRIHVVLSYGFLRRIASRSLSRSRTGRFRPHDTGPVTDITAGRPHRERDGT